MWVGGCTICFFSMFSATRAFEGYLGPTVSSGVAAYCEARWWRGASGTACLTRADMTCDETMAGVAQAGMAQAQACVRNRSCSVGGSHEAAAGGERRILVSQTITGQMCTRF